MFEYSLFKLVLSKPSLDQIFFYRLLQKSYITQRKLTKEYNLAVRRWKDYLIKQCFISSKGERNFGVLKVVFTPLTQLSRES